MQLTTNNTNLSSSNLKTENLKDSFNHKKLIEGIQNLREQSPNIKANSTGMLSDYLKSQKLINIKSSLSLQEYYENRETIIIQNKHSELKELNNLTHILYTSPKAQRAALAVDNKLNLEGKISNPILKNDLVTYLNSLTKFNRGLAKNQHILYMFNKANTKAYKFLFDKASKLLKLSFLGMGCLINRPVFKLTYTKSGLGLENTQKILIDLSYFIRKNKKRYLYNKVEVNENILYISHPDNEINNLKPNSQSVEQEILNNSIQVSQRNNILCKYNDKFQSLTDYLNSIFKSEVELDLVRLSKVFYDSHILAQDLALKSYKYKFIKLVSRLFRKVHFQKDVDKSNSLQVVSSFPTYLSGINIKLAGRTFRQRVVPRMTVKRVQKGSLTNINVQFMDRARFTSKTRRGSYSFTVTLGHVFSN